ncbi:MAG: hypothetical protein M3454_02160 [Actinomycetota bacterium]|nr:hypothetical protein [Actinomycetota bacterium]
MSEAGPPERVVLGRRDDSTMVGFQWTGAEPEGLNEPSEAENLGALWEGDELVTYSLGHLAHRFGHDSDGYMEDVD